VAKWNSQTTIGGTAVAVDDLLLLSDQSQAAGSRDRNISVSDLSYATGRFSVGQTGHGLSVGDCVWFDGTDYVEATADTGSNARVIGVIVEVIDVDNIVIQSTGFAFGLSGLSAGSTYYLQDAGGLGTSPGTVVVPVLLASSTSTGWLLFATQNEPDYEEGTWTPLISDGTNDATMGLEDAVYVRMGNIVYITTDLTIISAGSVTNARVYGLPFAARGGSFNYGGVACNLGVSLAVGTAGRSVTGVILSNNDFINLQLWDSTAGTTNLQGSEISAFGRLVLTGHYFV